MNSFYFEGWTLYPIEMKEKISKYSVNINELKGSDDERISNQDPSIVLVAQRNNNNHTFKVYFDSAFGYLNRHVLTIDDKWAQAMENFSSLMAFADYVAANEEAIAPLLKGEKLQIAWLDDSCLHCK